MKKYLLVGVLFFVAFLFIESSSAFARPAARRAPANSQSTVTVASSGTSTFRPGRQRVGLGFNGIPFDGSHREATQYRRALRAAR